MHIHVHVYTSAPVKVHLVHSGAPRCRCILARLGVISGSFGSFGCTLGVAGFQSSCASACPKWCLHATSRHIRTHRQHCVQMHFWFKDLRDSLYTYYITMPMFILNSYRCILYLQSLILTYSPIRSITDEFDHLEVISAELLLFFYLTSASILQKLGPCLLCSLICVQSTLTSNDAYVHCHCTTV